MLKQYQHIIGGLFRIVDACVIAGVWLFSYWLRFQVQIVEITEGVPPFSIYLGLIPFIMILWMVVFSSMNVYRSRRMLRRTDEAQLIIRAHIVTMLFFVSLTYMFSDNTYSRLVIGYHGLFGAFFLVSFRLILRNLLRHIRQQGFNLRHVVFVGENQAVEYLIERLDKFPEMGLRVKGVIVPVESSAQEVAGKPVLGKVPEVHSILEKDPPDQLIISLSRKQKDQLDQVLRNLKDQTIEIRLIPDVLEYVTLGCEVEDFDGLPVVNLNESPLDGWGAIAKRITDIVLAALGLILLSPVFLMIALAIKISSPGPVFYRQIRMGLDGQTFNMLKFRSMTVGAEKNTGATWADPEDERRTRIGGFLRSTSLDELPQLWNILKGEMALVGPRPERPVLVEQFRSQIPNYMLRHKVKAGLTGWAQVHGWRGNTSLDRRIEYDLFYIRNWSYFLDLKIIFMTLWKGFRHKNAY